MTGVDFELSIIDMVLFITFSVWSGFLTIRQVKSGRTTLEFNISNLINAAGREVRKHGMTLADDPNNEAKIKILESALDDYRCAYEDACEKYLSGKIDKKWFKNMYSEKIKRLIEEEVHKQFYISPNAKFPRTLQVYHEWFG